MTSMKILIVEDDKEIARVVRDGLSSDSHTVEIAEDGNEGGFLARNYEYDLIILDNSLPKKSGLTLCKEIRTGGKPVPIIFLSVNNDTDTKVAALESGADDYMTKPFSMAELRARIKAVARRPKNMAEQNLLVVGDVILDIDKQKVTRNGQGVDLTRKEFNVLEYLARNAGTVVSRSAIMEHVWTADSDPFSNTVESHIRNVRKKLDIVDVVDMVGEKDSGKNKKKGSSSAQSSGSKNIGKKSYVIRNVPGRGYIIDK